jgi:hypothetical protein
MRKRNKMLLEKHKNKGSSRSGRGLWGMVGVGSG